MGCASSSPVVNGGDSRGESAAGPMTETSKEESSRAATNTAIEAGEQVLNGKLN